MLVERETKHFTTAGSSLADMRNHYSAVSAVVMVIKVLEAINRVLVVWVT